MSQWGTYWLKITRLILIRSAIRSIQEIQFQLHELSVLNFAALRIQKEVSRLRGTVQIKWMITPSHIMRCTNTAIILKIRQGTDGWLKHHRLESLLFQQNGTSMYWFWKTKSSANSKGFRKRYQSSDSHSNTIFTVIYMCPYPKLIEFLSWLNSN